MKEVWVQVFQHYLDFRDSVEDVSDRLDISFEYLGSDIIYVYQPDREMKC